MQVVNNDQVFHVSWMYLNPELVRLIEQANVTEEEVKAAKKEKGGLGRLLGLRSIPQPNTTVCVIKDNEGRILVDVHVSRYHKDIHDTEKARRYSLTKALRILFPGNENKSLRREFWSTYVGRPRKVVKKVKEWNSDTTIGRFVSASVEN